MDTLLRDLRHALRTLLRTPGLTFTVIATLALGICGGTLIFSVLNAVLLQPLPYPDADRIVRVFQVNGEGRDRVLMSDPNFADLGERSRSFAALAQYDTMTTSVIGGNEPMRLTASHVSDAFFAVLGVQPRLGRLFLDEEQRPGGAPAALVSYRYWQRNLEGTPDTAATTLLIGGRSFTVAGVMPAGFNYPDNTDVWLPRAIEPVSTQRTAHNWQVVGRLAPGVDLVQTQADSSAIARALKAEYGNETWMTDLAVLPLYEVTVGAVRPLLTLLAAGAVLLFVVACANAFSLLLARTIARAPELAVRVALGAGHRHLFFQFIAETLLFCAAGAGIGLLIAWWGAAHIATLYAGMLPRIDLLRIDGATVGFTALLALGSTLLLSILLTRFATLSPALHGGRAGAPRNRTRDGLVAAQIALALVLLLCASLLGRSFLAILDQDPGFRTSAVLHVSIALPELAPGAGAAPIARFYDELIDRLYAIPGVETAGGVTATPLAGTPGWNGAFIALRRPDEIRSIEELAAMLKDPARLAFAEFRIASEDYFAALDIPLLRGRGFARSDAPDTTHAAIVSRSLAERRWPGEDPLGKFVQFGNMDGDLTPFTIVGVVGDVREFGLDVEPRPTFYAYYRQRPTALANSFTIAIRTNDTGRLIPLVRDLVRAMNPGVVAEFHTAEQLLNSSTAPRRLSLLLFAIAGVGALLIALTAIHGAIAFHIGRQSRAIGVRLALGARPERIVAGIVAGSLRLASTGIAAGVVVTLGAVRLLRSLLFGISPYDLLTFAVTVGAVLLFTAFAAWIPARRAAAIDPLQALRAE